jgi:hypothetical protein
MPVAAWRQFRPAKDRTFVISLRAQIDEALDALASFHAAPTMPGFGRAPALRGGGGMPSLAPVMSRMASNTAALGVQRGFMSHINSTPMPTGGRPSGITHTFSSPAQQRATISMRDDYTSRATQASEAAEHTPPPSPSS